jgi:hypothetical protein
MAVRTTLEVWKAKTFCSHTKDEEDECSTDVEILKTKESPDGASPPIQKELGEYPKDTSEPATVRDGLLMKLMSHWLNKFSFKKEMPLHRDRETMKGDTGILADYYIQVTKKDRDAITLEVKILRGPCEDTSTLEEQLNLITVRQYKLLNDSGSLMHEAICMSEETEAMMKDRNALKLEIEKLQEQLKKTAALEEQLNQMTVECNELRKYKEALIYEAISISEEKKDIKRDREVLTLEIENV